MIKILAIDDNSVALISLKAIVKVAFPDLVLDTASDGLTGIHRAIANDPDVILLDIFMPGLDGLEVCRRLKQDKRTNNIPVVFLTALKDDKDSRIKALEAGAEGFLSKPIDQTEFTALIRAMVKIKAANVQIRNGKEHLALLVADRTRELEQSQSETLNLLDELKTENEVRRKTEEALRENMQLFQGLFNASPDAIILIDPHGPDPHVSWPIVDCNKSACLMNGYTREELVGQTIDILNEIEGTSEERDAYFDELKKKGTIHKEVYHRHRNGHIFNIEVLSSIVTLGGREMVLGIDRDITERKRAEEALRESEDRYRQLVEMSPDAIAIHQQGKIVYINTAGAIHIGAQTPQEMIGKSILNLVHPDYRAAVIQRVEKTVSGESAPYTVEKFIKLDGTIFDVEVAAIPSVYQGEPATQVVIRDITERKQAEEEILLKNEQLLKLNAEKDKFFSIISHDLRSPFNSFLGLTEIMAGDIQSLTMEEIQEYSATMRNSATNLYRLLENLLQWSKMQQGSIPFNPELLQLLQIVEECFAMAKEPAQNKGIEITHKIPDDLNVFADNNILQTIIRNLVSNALKFTPKGGKISVSAKATEDKSVEISVKDTGIGMTNEMVNNLFRLDAKTNREGTEGEPSSGLGLLLCKEFVEKNGGKIWVESEVEKGTTFYFTIP